MTACFQSVSLEIKRAEREVQKGQFGEALQRFKRIVAKGPQTEAGLNAARLGARLALLDMQDGRTAIEFYRQLIISSPNEIERREAQTKIAQIYYDNLHDYRAAITEYNRLVLMVREPNEEFRFRMPLAKSYYFLNNYVQARAELKTLLAKELAPNERFDVILLLANISMTLKSLDDAARSFEGLLREHPERARKENVALNLVMVFEEQKKYQEAIEILESIRSTFSPPEFIDLRIKKLKERLSQLPGAKGLRK